jgi:hypothetical protein
MEFTPRWYLRLRTQRKGKRLPDLANYKAPLPNVAMMPEPLASDYSTGLISATSDPVGWAHWEYRFWMLALKKDANSFKYVPDYGICRRCGAEGKTFVARRAHGNTTGCCKILTDAYLRLLNAEKKCIICNTHTQIQRFGALFCQDACAIKFFYDQFTPPALNAAISLVEREYAQ